MTHIQHGSPGSFMAPFQEPIHEMMQQVLEADGHTFRESIMEQMVEVGLEHAQHGGPAHQSDSSDYVHNSHVTKAVKAQEVEALGDLVAHSAGALMQLSPVELAHQTSNGHQTSATDDQQLQFTTAPKVPRPGIPPTAISHSAISGPASVVAPAWPPGSDCKPRLKKGFMPTAGTVVGPACTFYTGSTSAAPDAAYNMRRFSHPDPLECTRAHAPTLPGVCTPGSHRWSTGGCADMDSSHHLPHTSHSGQLAAMVGMDDHSAEIVRQEVDVLPPMVPRGVVTPAVVPGVISSWQGLVCSSGSLSGSGSRAYPSLTPHARAEDVLCLDRPIFLPNAGPPPTAAASDPLVPVAHPRPLRVSQLAAGRDKGGGGSAMPGDVHSRLGAFMLGQKLSQGMGIVTGMLGAGSDAGSGTLPPSSQQAMDEPLFYRRLDSMHAMLPKSPCITQTMVPSWGQLPLGPESLGPSSGEPALPSDDTHLLPSPPITTRHSPLSQTRGAKALAPATVAQDLLAAKTYTVPAGHAVVGHAREHQVVGGCAISKNGNSAAGTSPPWPPRDVERCWAAMSPPHATHLPQAAPPLHTLNGRDYEAARNTNAGTPARAVAASVEATAGDAFLHGVTPVAVAAVTTPVLVPPAASSRASSGGGGSGLLGSARHWVASASSMAASSQGPRKGKDREGDKLGALVGRIRAMSRSLMGTKPLGHARTSHPLGESPPADGHWHGHGHHMHMGDAEAAGGGSPPARSTGDASSPSSPKGLLFNPFLGALGAESPTASSACSALHTQVVCGGAGGGGATSQDSGDVVGSLCSHDSDVVATALSSLQLDGGSLPFDFVTRPDVGDQLALTTARLQRTCSSLSQRGLEEVDSMGVLLDSGCVAVTTPRAVASGGGGEGGGGGAHVWSAGSGVEAGGSPECGLCPRAAQRRHSVMATVVRPPAEPGNSVALEAVGGVNRPKH